MTDQMPDWPAYLLAIGMLISAAGAFLRVWEDRDVADSWQEEDEDD